MPGFDGLEADVALNPYSARGLAEKARACGIALGKAPGWPHSLSPTESTLGAGWASRENLTKI